MPNTPKKFTPRLNVRNAPRPVIQWKPSRRSLNFILAKGGVPITAAESVFITYSRG